MQRHRVRATRTVTAKLTWEPYRTMRMTAVAAGLTNAEVLTWALELLAEHLEAHPNALDCGPNEAI